MMQRKEREVRERGGCVDTEKSRSTANWDLGDGDLSSTNVGLGDLLYSGAEFVGFGGSRACQSV